jgi:hypothetical protein
MEYFMRYVPFFTLIITSMVVTSSWGVNPKLKKTGKPEKRVKEPIIYNFNDNNIILTGKSSVNNGVVTPKKSIYTKKRPLKSTTESTTESATRCSSSEHQGVSQINNTFKRTRICEEGQEFEFELKPNEFYEKVVDLGDDFIELNKAFGDNFLLYKPKKDTSSGEIFYSSGDLLKKLKKNSDNPWKNRAVQKALDAAKNRSSDGFTEFKFGNDNKEILESKTTDNNSNKKLKIDFLLNEEDNNKK